MSDYQYIPFSETEEDFAGIKHERIINDSDQSSSLKRQSENVTTPSSARASLSSSSLEKSIALSSFSSSSSSSSLSSSSSSPSSSSSSSLSPSPSSSSSSSLTSSSFSPATSPSPFSPPTSSLFSSSTSESSSPLNRQKVDCEVKRERICIELTESHKRIAPSNVAHSGLKQSPSSSSLQRHQQSLDDANTITLSAKYNNNGAPGKAKIPRPANAFMLFANEWRKKLAVENPRESNKDISVRLGLLWKNMGKEAKEKYFALAREVDAEHKRKYPDYVYNPKEARLRKAMREQSRELSRQSILQTTIVNGTTNACKSNSGASCGTNFGRDAAISGSADYATYSLGYAPPALPATTGPTLPGNSSDTASRIVNSWFPIGHMSSSSPIKPMFSQRVIGCFPQDHQLRTSDKTEEVVRKQLECPNASSAASDTTATCCSNDFSVHRAVPQLTSETTIGVPENNEYSGVGESADAQKWHPYQSTATSYHTRSRPCSKITGRYEMQGVNLHSHELWNQFPGVPLFSMTPLNPMIREPRHMVLLQNQLERHCGTSTDEYANTPNKLNVTNRLKPGYPQSNYQESQKSIEDAPRWEVPTLIPPTHPLKNIPTNAQCEIEPRFEERQSEREQAKKFEENEFFDHQRLSLKTRPRQPLPGFHQAFGSTGIGRFSRTEFIANVFSENIGDGSSEQMIPDGYLPASMFPFPTSTDCLRDNITISRNGLPTAQGITVPEDCYWIAPNIGISMSNIADPNYVAFMDLSHRLNCNWTHPSSILPHDYSPVISNSSTIISPEQLLPSFNESERTGMCSIDGEIYPMRDDNKYGKNEKVDTKEIPTGENIQQDNNDDDDKLINVDDIDP